MAFPRFQSDDSLDRTFGDAATTRLSQQSFLWRRESGMGGEVGRGGVRIPGSSVRPSVRSTLSDHVMDGLQRAAAAAGCSGSWKLDGRFFLQPTRLRPPDRENEGGVRPSVRLRLRPDSLEAPINFFSRSCRMIVGKISNSVRGDRASEGEGEAKVSTAKFFPRPPSSSEKAAPPSAGRMSGFFLPD